jgi:predicted dehydrogenase/putative sterol carrier protein
MNMNKMNIGFIGCGRISDLHYPGYKENNDARIYAVCDSDEEIAKTRKQEWNAEKYFTDYKEMLQDPALDAVEILSPQPLHEPMVMEAARAKKHIALQKPMTIDLKSADRMLNTVKNSDIVFKVTDNYLFYPPIVLARKMIENGEIGTPTNLRIKMISGGFGGWDIPPSAWEWRMAEKEAGRGLQTFDHGHHLWAAAWYLLGDVERVAGWIDSVDGLIDSPAAIIWKYKEGVSYGMCEYAHAPDMNIPSKYYANDEWFEITGSKGIIIIHRCTGNIVDGPGVSVFNGNEWKQYSDVKTDWVEGFIGATHNFIDSIKGESAPLLSGDQGREILKLALAISKSSRVRREVFLDEMDCRFPVRYTKKRIKQEIKKAAPKKSFLASIGFGAKDASYAPQARSLTENLAVNFNPEAVEGWEAEIGVHLLAEGNAPETLYKLVIKNKTAVIEEGKLPDNPALVLKAPAGTWAAILLGKKRIETAFLQGKLKLVGKAEHGLKLRDAFGI